METGEEERAAFHFLRSLMLALMLGNQFAPSAIMPRIFLPCRSPSSD